MVRINNPVTGLYFYTLTDVRDHLVFVGPAAILNTPLLERDAICTPSTVRPASDNAPSVDPTFGCTGACGIRDEQLT